LLAPSQNNFHPSRLFSPSIFQWFILALWLLFIVYWGISALGAKRSIGNTAWWTQSLLRLGIVVLMRPNA
jgi:hypothetical protein